MKQIEIRPGEIIPGYPQFSADNIQDLLNSRETLIAMHTKAYEEYLIEERTKPIRIQIAQRRRFVRPSEGTFGRAALPLVGHDPKKDKPDSLRDILLLEEQKITIFDASGELEARLPGAFIRWAFAGPDERQLPEKLLKNETWASGVVIEFEFRRRFGKPNNRFVLTHVDNSHIDGGKRILTTQGALRVAGLDVKR